MELNYKASNIAKAERLHNANFFKTLEGFGESTPSISDIIFVLEAGGLTEEEAGATIDDKGLVDSIQMAVEGLQTSGFLAKIQEEVAESPLKATSPTTGSKTKA